MRQSPKVRLEMTGDADMLTSWHPRSGLMLGIAATSIFAGIFDVKHYLHLQLVPHITKHHQVSTPSEYLLEIIILN